MVTDRRHNTQSCPGTLWARVVWSRTQLLRLYCRGLVGVDVVVVAGSLLARLRGWGNGWCVCLATGPDTLIGVYTV